MYITTRDSRDNIQWRIIDGAWWQMIWCFFINNQKSSFYNNQSLISIISTYRYYQYSTNNHKRYFHYKRSNIISFDTKHYQFEGWPHVFLLLNLYFYFPLPMIFPVHIGIPPVKTFGYTITALKKKLAGHYIMSTALLLTPLTSVSSYSMDSLSASWPVYSVFCVRKGH